MNPILDNPNAPRANVHRSGRAAWWALGIFAIAVGVVVALVWGQREETFYSDADTIKEPAKTARIRDILWQPAEPLPELLNTAIDEYEPRITADGQTLFFVRGKTGQDADIYWSRQTPQGWSQPSALSSVNSEYDDLGPEPSADGLTLFFYSDRPNGQGGYDLWLARRGSDSDPAFAEPINLGPLVNSEFNEYGPAMTPDGSALYFASNRPQPGDQDATDPDAWPATLREDFYHRDYDLYLCPMTQRGAGLAEPLIALNSAYNEGAPAVSPVGDFVYFSSDRPGGFGAYDLYRSRRLRGQHESAENLGRGINTEANELDPGLTHLGYALFFSSDRPGQRIDAEKPNPYNLYYSSSREVFTETQVHKREAIHWAALWRQLGPSLVWSLLALLLTLLLLLLLRNGRYGRLSLLTRCLLASLLAHLLLLFLFNFWEVTATLADTFGQGGEIRVALVTGAGRHDIERQIRGEMTDVQAPPVERLTVQRPASTLLVQVTAQQARMAVQSQPWKIEHQPATVMPVNDVPSKPIELPSPTRPDQPAHGPSLDLSMPQNQSRADPGEAVSSPPSPMQVRLPRNRSAVASVNAAAPTPTPVEPVQQRVEWAGQPVLQSRAREAQPPRQRPADATLMALRPVMAFTAEVDLPADTTQPRRDEAVPSAPAAVTERPNGRSSLGAVSPTQELSVAQVRLDVDQSAPAQLIAKVSDLPNAPSDHARLVDIPIQWPEPLAVSPLLPTGLALPTEREMPTPAYAHRVPEVREGILERMGGSDETERAVSSALEWLAKHQSSDGRWDGTQFDETCGACDGATEFDVDVALTGLSLLCFLGADHTQIKDGPYRRHVQKAIDWLVARQGPDGDLRQGESMYSQGIAAIALSEAYGMTKDARLTEPVARAANFIVQARNRRHGGWRYEPGQAGDTSVLGWQIMALTSAKRSGVEVPSQAFEAAADWMERVASTGRPGLYAYQPRRKVTLAMSAEGMFVQQLLGARRSQANMQASAAYLVDNLPNWESDLNTYYWYYATLAMFQYQGTMWDSWNRALTRTLLDNQRDDGPVSGSWNPDGEWASVGGRIYQTALCTLMLEVYYRYLPIYSDQITADAIGAIQGRVVDASTRQGLAGARLYLDLPDRPPLIVKTDAEGRYELFPPEVPDFFALSATRPGYIPRTANVASSTVMGTTLNLDFELDPSDPSVVVLEAVPQVHHLGDDRFDGRINSQFQKQAETDVLTVMFAIDCGQLSGAIATAQVTMLAKGVQMSHRIVINGTVLDARLDHSPRDGSFGEFTASFDAALLRTGDNTLEIRASNRGGDVDDFEVVNIKVRLIR